MLGILSFLTAGLTSLPAVICGHISLKRIIGYIGNVLTADQAPRPIVMAPFVKGTDRFDPSCFDGKAVILWTDMSVRSMIIERTSGQVMLDGRNLLDPNHPIWGGQPPVLALPE